MMRAKSRGHWLIAALVAAVMLSAGAAMACPICFAGRVTPLGQKIDAADAVVLATPLGPSRAFRAITAIKGAVAAGTLIFDTNPAPRELVAPGRPLLLVRNKSSQQWSALGSIGESEASWLRRFAVGGPAFGTAVKPTWPQTLDATFDMTDARWADRLALVAPKLESSERLAAEIAYGEVARAPYRLLRDLHGSLNAGEVLAWLEDSALAARRPAYMLLLGIVGGPAEADIIESRIEAQRGQHSAANLAALIAADLEIRGPSRVTFIEETYFADKTRKLAEIEAALLALSVQGTADATIPRARVVAAYRTFIKARPPMAAFVIQDLTGWRAFDAAGDLDAAMRSGAIRDPASQYAVLSYLQHSPATSHLVQPGTDSDLPP
jgi:hypothetical protein